MSTGSKYYPPGATDLLKAIADKDVRRLGRLLTGGADPNASEPDAVAPALLAAYLNLPEAIDLLARHGAVYPRFAWIEDLWEYGKPEKYDEFRSSEKPIVEASQAAIAYGNLGMLEQLLSIPGAERGLLKKAGLKAWSAAQFADKDRHRILGPLCAKVIGARVDLTDHDPVGLAQSLSAFYDGMNTFYNNRFEDIPHWETQEFGTNRSGVLSLPFAFWSVMANLDRDYISRIKTNDDPDDTGIRFEWQPDAHTYVIASLKESAPSSWDNDDASSRLTGRLIYSKSPDVISRIASTLTAVRDNDVERLISYADLAHDPYCGFGTAEDVALYAIDHGSERVLEHLVNSESSLQSEEVLNKLAKRAISHAHNASIYAHELRRAASNDENVSFISELDYDKTHRIVKTVVASANEIGEWLKLDEIGRYFIKMLLEDRPANHQDLLEHVLSHLDSAPGLMAKVDGWGDQTGAMVRAWRAKSAVDRVLKQTRTAVAP